MTRDTLDAVRIEPLLRSRFGHPYLYHERCRSTQDLVATAETEGAVAVAEEQTEGRGRLGRAWCAPPGTAILCSVLLAPPTGRPPPQLALVGGLATARAVERIAGAAAQIKWPNDVVMGGCKLAGVLAEARGSSVTLGIGLNVNQAATALPQGATLPAASLRSVTGRMHSRAHLLVELLAQLELAYERWVNEGLPALADELRARDYLLGWAVRCAQGAGTAAGIADDGRLVLELDSGRRLIASGEVTLVG